MFSFDGQMPVVPTVPKSKIEGLTELAEDFPNINLSQVANFVEKVLQGTSVDKAFMDTHGYQSETEARKLWNSEVVEAIRPLIPANGLGVEVNSLLMEKLIDIVKHGDAKEVIQASSKLLDAMKHNQDTIKTDKLSAIMRKIDRALDKGLTIDENQEITEIKEW